MNKILFLLLSGFLVNTSFSQEINPDLKKPVSFSVQVEDAKHKVLYSGSINNVSKNPSEKIILEEYVDNCVKNKSVIENSKSTIKSGFNLSLNTNTEFPDHIILTMSKMVSKKKIDTGECYIEEPVLATATVNQGLPFAYFEYKFKLKDSEGKEYPEMYFLKINSSKLKN